jgi:hypothetical protein
MYILTSRDFGSRKILISNFRYFGSKFCWNFAKDPWNFVLHLGTEQISTFTSEIWLDFVGKIAQNLLRLRRECTYIIWQSLRGVVVDLSGLRDRGPGFKTRSRLLSFTKAVTNFRTLHVLGFSCTNEFFRIPSCKRR